MAIKPIADIKAEITALSSLIPLIKIAPIQSILTDMADSFGGYLHIAVDTSLASLTTGANTLNHGLTATIYEVYLDKGSYLLKLSFTYIDDDNISIDWPAATESNPEIHLFYKI